LDAAISIPSGAIKRFGCIICSTCRIVISIPSGAIKRLSAIGKLAQQFGFQFLLVRLRVTGGRELDLKVKFQFLLVRLRDVMNNPAMSSSTEFQFLLVRLRG